MKIVPSSRRRRYVAGVGTCFIVLALIAGMAGCGGPHTLNISSTAGGSVTTPGEGMFSYGAGTVLTLVATPDTGYQFVRWTGDLNRVADVYSATTNITMNDDYSITANFDYSP